MKHNDNLTSAGIYMVFCCLLNLAYIGKSRRLPKRMEEHLALLKHKRHHVRELQEDYTNYGPDYFMVLPLEFVDSAEELSKKEKAWIRKCQIEGGVYNRANAVTEEHRKQYESTKAASGKLDFLNGRRGRMYSFVSPAGEVVEVRGLRGLCEAYNLNQSHMSKIARGLLSQHRGWRLHQPVDASTE